MSGLEPLAALGLVCNVLQLVDVGRQTISFIKHVYSNGSIDDKLKENVVLLEDISAQIEANRMSAKCLKHEQQLLKTAERCNAAARDLREEVNYLLSNAKQGSLTSALKAAAKMNWRKHRLNRLKNDMDGAERLLQTGLLARTWYVSLLSSRCANNADHTRLGPGTLRTPWHSTWRMPKVTCAYSLNSTEMVTNQPSALYRERVGETENISQQLPQRAKRS